MFFEKAKKLLTYLTNEFMIFLEYPLDYIEEFGDDMKKLDTTDKVIKIGKLLIEHSFDAARKMGYDVNINFGNPGNYVSRGFVSCKRKNVSFIAQGNFPTALLVCELIPNALDGKAVTFIPSTAADCCEDTAAVEAFDSTFPPKEKKWMPSQEEFYIYSHSSVVR